MKILNNEIDPKIKKTEDRKARYAVIFFSLIYIPAFIANYIYLYNQIENSVESPSVYRYLFTVVLSTSIICLVIAIIQKLVNLKFKIRNKVEFRQALIFSYLIFIICYLLFLTNRSFSIIDSAVYVASYITIAGLVLFAFLTEYNVNKMGIYTQQLNKYVNYKTDRTFTFKLDLTDSELVNSKKPLEDLTEIVEKQTTELKFADDLGNIGKYYSYTIQSHFYEEFVFVVIGFSKTGKTIDKVISVNSSYYKEDFEEKMQLLNNAVNLYLRRD